VKCAQFNIFLQKVHNAMRQRRQTTFRLFRETKIFANQTRVGHIADVPSIALAKIFANRYIAKIKATTYRDVNRFVIPLVDRLIILQSTNGVREKIIYYDFVRYALKITEKFLMIDEERQIVIPTSPKNSSCINEYNCWKCIFYTVVLVEIALIWVWFFGLMPDFTKLFM